MYWSSNVIRLDIVATSASDTDRMNSARAEVVGTDTAEMTSAALRKTAATFEQEDL